MQDVEKPHVFFFFFIFLLTYIFSFSVIHVIFCLQYYVWALMSHAMEAYQEVQTKRLYCII